MTTVTRIMNGPTGTAGAGTGASGPAADRQLSGSWPALAGPPCGHIVLTIFYHLKNPIAKRY